MVITLNASTRGTLNEILDGLRDVRDSHNQYAELESRAKNLIRCIEKQLPHDRPGTLDAGRTFRCAVRLGEAAHDIAQMGGGDGRTRLANRLAVRLQDLVSALANNGTKCHYCGATVSLKANGTLSSHQREMTRFGQRQSGRRTIECGGSGEAGR